MKDPVAVKFHINGKLFEVGPEVGHEVLANFIRNSAHLKGTKVLCKEGGCGLCIVQAEFVDPVTKQLQCFSVNSCLVPVLKCNGWSITTIEGLGSRDTGYHPLQRRLAEFNGTQCGYCSPGMVMAAQSLFSAKDGAVSVKEIEDSLDGNICRCTGYRPILEAFKSLATDAPPTLTAPVDIEECSKRLKNGCCPQTGEPCVGSCQSSSALQRIPLHDGSVWYRPASLAELYENLAEIGENKYRIVSGNTGHGVYKNEEAPSAFVDVGGIPDLFLYSTEGVSSVEVGGALGLTTFKQILEEIREKREGYSYSASLAKHVGMIGNVSVRNIGSLAGNLMLKHGHPEFPSDLFVMLEAVNARLIIGSRSGEVELSLIDFLSHDMRQKVILKIRLFPLSANHMMRSFKITPRSVNAHAYVNAAFLAKVNSDYIIEEKPNLVYGGINAIFHHATATEEFLANKNIADRQVLQTALNILGNELKPDYKAPDAKPEYKRSLAQTLFYKFVLGILGDKVQPSLRSGAADLIRPVSSSQQTYDVSKIEGELYKPTVKFEGYAQTAGEAQYTNDIPVYPNELHAVFVLSDLANAKIVSIDPSVALVQEGVVDFVSAKDVPCRNLFIGKGDNFDWFEDEVLFADERVVHNGQPLGLILANTPAQATAAAKLVKVEYEVTEKPVIFLKDGMRVPTRVVPNTMFGPAEGLFYRGDLEAAMAESDTILEGSMHFNGQFHFSMEPQAAVCVPTEDGVDVFAATQDCNQTQHSIAQALGITKSSVNVQVKRLGGAFGSKISRSILPATAVAVAANKVKRPVRMYMDLETNMRTCGSRSPTFANYKVGVTKEGKLLAVKVDIYCDCGCNINEGSSCLATLMMQSCYDAKAWRLTPYTVKTDKPHNTYMRCPGICKAIGLIENIFEHVGCELKKNSVDLRLMNLQTSGPNIAGKEMDGALYRRMLNQLLETSDYRNRKAAVDKFNLEHRWKKRGIGMTPLVFPLDYGEFKYNGYVAVYSQDGSVAVSHGGIDCGQGVNTKVAQAVATELGIPMDYIKFKATNTLLNPNGSTTGASLTSDLCTYACLVSAREIKERMRPTRDANPDLSWKELVQKCHNENVDLCARHLYTPKDQLKGYNIYAAALVEVEMDILTGERQILRTDIYEDAGQSVSPLVDIGQVEGAFVMGLGFWLSERLLYDPETGRNITAGTWNYKPPLAKDIPIDFRVTLLKDAPNPFGVLRAKSTGEAALSSAAAVMCALREAITSARADSGVEGWFQMDGPITVEAAQQLCLLRPEHLTF